MARSYKMSPDGQTKYFIGGGSEKRRQFGEGVQKRSAFIDPARQAENDAAMDQYMANRSARRGAAIQNEAMSDQAKQQSKVNRFAMNAVVDEDQQRDVQTRRRAIMDPAIDRYLQDQAGPPSENLTRGPGENTIDGQPALMSSTLAQGTMRPAGEGTINGEQVYAPAVRDAAESWMQSTYGGAMSTAEKQALINQQTAEARNASQFEIAKMRNDSQMNRERYKSEYDSTLQTLRMQSQNDQQAKQLLAGFHKQALDLLDNEERRLAEEYATISYLRPGDPKIIDLRQRQASVKQSKQDRMDSYLQSVMQPPPQYNVGPPQGGQPAPDPTMGATGYAGPPQGDQSQAQAPQSDMPESFVAAVARASTGKGNPTPDIEEIKAAWQQLSNTERARFLGGAVK